MSEKSIRCIAYGLKTGLFILPILSLIVASSLFFPFITGKNFFFRIMVEILFFFWVFVACFDKNYRPRKSPLFIALAAALFFLSLATIFGANPYRSFWSNFERMEGLITHIHLFAYFLILTSVFRKEKDWKWFFLDLIAVSFVAIIYAFMQYFGILAIHQSDIRLDATFGNATYLAIFLIFHLFLIAWSFLRTQNKLLRYGLVILFGLECAVIFLTATRGAILGLLGGIFLFAAFASIFTKNKRLRYGAVSVFAVLLLVVSLFLLFKNSGFVQKNFVLSRIASISFSERTVTSRFTIWQMSFQGFLEKPFLGWGPENFNLVFNKYYQPVLWPQEPWFDRSHNVIFDWLISGGIMGFLAYWSIWGTAIFIVFKSFKKKYLTLIEMGLILALFAAYFFHNLFVFDNLTSYYLFFGILGYIHFCYLMMARKPQEEIKPEKNHQFQKDIGLASYLIISVAFIFVIFSLYFANLKPLLACHQLLVVIMEEGGKGTDINFMIGEFDKVFSYKTFANNETREQLGSYAQQVLAASAIPQEDKVKIATKTIDELKRQIAEAPKDARAYLFLTAIYLKNNQPNEALEMASKALELSPQKQQIHFIIADIYLSTGQNDKAFEILKKAYESAPAYSDAAKNLAMVSIIVNKTNLTEKILGEAEKNWATKFGGIIQIQQFINAYARVGNYGRVKELWQIIIAENPDNAQYHVNLAATYLRLGERENSIKELEKTIELNPSFKQQGEYFINEIKAGRNP